jgi:hypothetical protein
MVVLLSPPNTAQHNQGIIILVFILYIKNSYCGLPGAESSNCDLLGGLTPDPSILDLGCRDLSGVGCLAEDRAYEPLCSL